MSFVISFAMPNLVILAADRRFRNGDKYSEGKKLHRVNSEVFGAGLGWEYFGRFWIRIARCFKSFQPGLFSIIGWSLNITYYFFRKAMRESVTGFTSLTFGGFIKRRPFIVHFDSKDKFKPSLLHCGEMHSCFCEENTDIDRLIKDETQKLGYLMKHSIEFRKGFFKDQIQKIMLISPRVAVVANVNTAGVSAASIPRRRA